MYRTLALSSYARSLPDPHRVLMHDFQLRRYRLRFLRPPPPSPLPLFHPCFLCRSPSLALRPNRQSNAHHSLCFPRG